MKRAAEDAPPEDACAETTEAAPEAKKAKLEAKPYTRPASASDDVLFILETMNPGGHRPRVVLKERFGDFVVREVTEVGHVTRVTNLDVPAGLLPLDDSAAGLPSDLKERAALGRAQLVSAGVAETAADELLASLNRSSGLPEGTEVVLTVAGGDDSKQKRTEVHGIVKRYFPKVTSVTVDGAIHARKPDQRAVHQLKKAAEWPKGTGPFVHFTLYKENLETAQALKSLAAKVGAQGTAFSIAGTKDKRAITCQRVSAFKVAPSRLSQLNASGFGRDAVVKLGDFTLEPEGLRLGMLGGNRFSIVLRDTPGDEASVAAAKRVLSAVGETGFVNYFGHQRFGSTAEPTFKVAVLLMRNEIKEAVSLLFRSKAEVVPEFQAAADSWSEAPENPQKAWQLCPHFCHIEKGCLQALMRDPKSYALAFDALPRNTRMLYFHALQAVVWNEMATVRIRLSRAILPGDLVLADAPAKRGSLPAVLVVTESDIAEGKYTLADVVLPLPGVDRELAFPGIPGVDREACAAILDKYSSGALLDGSAASVGVVNFKTLNLYGGYRSLVKRPGNLTWCFVKYDDNEQDLQQTEWSRAESRLLKPGEEGVHIAGCDELPQCHGQGDKTALQVSFTLPPSCYATMFLREIATVDVRSK